MFRVKSCIAIALPGDSPYEALGPNSIAILRDVHNDGVLQAVASQARHSNSRD